MADTKNVYEQLEELKEKLNEANKPRTLVEQLANNDPAVIEFVKNAKRVWRYCGDKSELKRRNKKKTAAYYYRILFACDISHHSVLIFNKAFWMDIADI